MTSNISTIMKINTDAQERAEMWAVISCSLCDIDKGFCGFVSDWFEYISPCKVNPGFLIR